MRGMSGSAVRSYIRRAAPWQWSTEGTSLAYCARRRRAGSPSMVIGENDDAQARLRFDAPAADTPPEASAAGRGRRGALRTMGLGLITGAADDDCSAIGTYASAGATVGPAF